MEIMLFWPKYLYVSSNCKKENLLFILLTILSSLGSFSVEFIRIERR